MTVPNVTEAIIESGNDYLGSLKSFNGEVYESIAEYDWGTVEQVVYEKEKSHGRVEERVMKIVKAESLPTKIRFQLLKYAGAACVIRVERKREILNSEANSEEVVFYVGSQKVSQLTALEIYHIQRTIGSSKTNVIMLEMS